jgi:hypothetical protein
MCKAYQSILQVIRDRTEDIENKHMQKYLDKTINDVTEANKTFKPMAGNWRIYLHLL